MNSRMWVNVSVLGGKIHFEISETFEPSNDGAIMSSFIVERRKEQVSIYKVPKKEVIHEMHNLV